MPEDLDQKRRQDLEKSLRETDDLIDQYRQRQIGGGDPRKMSQYRQEITALTELRKEYQAELAQLQPAIVSQERTDLQQLELIDLPDMLFSAAAKKDSGADSNDTAAELANAISGEPLADENLIERIMVMAEAIFDNVIEPWDRGDGVNAHEGLGIRLTRRQYDDIAESRGDLKTFAQLYRDGAQLENAQIRMTTRFMGELRSKFESLLRLIEQIPESALTLTVKFELQNALLTAINTMRELESELASAPATGRVTLRQSWAASVAG